MSGIDDRLSKLTPEQRRLLEVRLRERGLGAREGAVGAGGDGGARGVTDGGLTHGGDASGGAARGVGGAHGRSVVGAGTFAGEETSPATGVGAWRLHLPVRPLRFSLYFFSDDGSKETGAKYRLVLDSARFADENGFDAVWTPERHFQAFGGLYPNPSVLGAALAAVTRRVGIRAGSVALPLHNPIRVAEEWAVVDNLSNGRVAISFASGWHPDDFVLYPSPYEDRKNVMFRGIETIRRLWSGDSIVLEGPDGRQVEVRALPRPVQAELPVWITTAGSVETWERAGSIGANVLAALVGYSPDELAGQIARYRNARAAAGHEPASGIVTLVAHTYVGTDDAAVREQVREPMTEYLKSYLKQFQKAGLEGTGALERDARDVAALAFEHYFESSTLLGTQNKCARVLDELVSCGADEVACLVDFGLEADTVLAALPRLAELREHYSSGTLGAASATSAREKQHANAGKSAAADRNTPAAQEDPPAAASTSETDPIDRSSLSRPAVSG